VRRAGEPVRELEPTGPVLGAADRAVYAEESVTLVSGDVLALYTDGISEAGRGRRDFWGVPGVAACLHEAPPGARAVDVVAHVMAGAVTHAQGDLHDDVCLLVGVVESNGGPPPA
jgi:serine phosphatase RsbU (regulator of sigma subunit)